MVAQIDKPVNRTQKMILRNVVFQRELIKQRRLCFLLRSHHRQIPNFSKGIESAKGLQINKGFSTELAESGRSLHGRVAHAVTPKADINQVTLKSGHHSAAPCAYIATIFIDSCVLQKPELRIVVEKTRTGVAKAL